jgi:hypothetical protein
LTAEVAITVTAPRCRHVLNLSQHLRPLEEPLQVLSCQIDRSSITDCFTQRSNDGVESHIPLILGPFIEQIEGIIETGDLLDEMFPLNEKR